MDSTQDLANRLAIYLSAYKHNVAIKSKARLLDIAIFGEAFCRDIAEIAFGYKDLVNLNLKMNYPAIDLGSAEAACAIQVTITASSAKIAETLEKFFEHGLDSTYSKLKIIILGDKQGTYKSKRIIREKGAFRFDPNEDIYDLGDLFDILVKAADPEKFEAFNKRMERALSSSIRPYLLGFDRPGQNLRQLFEAHDVTPTNAVSALRRFEVNRAIYSSTVSLSEKASKELIQYVARQFSVSGDWIDGQCSHIYCNGPDYETTTDWRRSLRGAYDLVERIRSQGEELDLIIPTGFTLSEMDESPDIVDQHSSSYAHFFLSARRQMNDFSVGRFRLILGDPITYRPCREGIFLLFMAAELYEIQTGCKTYLNVHEAPSIDILNCYSGDLFLADLFRLGQLVGNHKDFVWFGGAPSLKATKNVPKLVATMLQENLTDFVAHQRSPLPRTIEFA